MDNAVLVYLLGLMLAIILGLALAIVLCRRCERVSEAAAAAVAAVAATAATGSSESPRRHTSVPGSPLQSLPSHAQFAFQAKHAQPLNVFLDERNFWHFATSQIPQPKMALNLLRDYLQRAHPSKKIQMHIVTKNSNQLNYTDELYKLKARAGPDDILYIANTVFDTNKISQSQAKHHLRGRDDFLMLLMALEHQDRGEDVLVLSNDNFRDVDKMHEISPFNAIVLHRDKLDKRHIDPIRFRYTERLKRLVRMHAKPFPSLKSMFDSR